MAIQKCEQKNLKYPYAYQHIHSGRRKKERKRTCIFTFLKSQEDDVAQGKKMD